MDLVSMTSKMATKPFPKKTDVNRKRDSDIKHGKENGLGK